MLKSTSKTAFLPTFDKGVSDFFKKYGYHVTTNPAEMWDADLSVFVGGEDVSPFLYGEKKLSCTTINPERDMHEVGMFKLMSSDHPKVGICRGAQFLNVMSGGSMYQDVDNHCIGHTLTDNVTGEVVRVTSTHHQMMVPSDIADVLCYAKESTKKRAAGYTLKCSEVHKDAEVVWYEHNQTLCVQYHPEYGYTTDTCVKHFWDLMLRQYGTPVLTEEALQLISDVKGEVKSVA